MGRLRKLKFVKTDKALSVLFADWDKESGPFDYMAMPSINEEFGVNSMDDFGAMDKFEGTSERKGGETLESGMYSGGQGEENEKVWSPGPIERSNLVYLSSLEKALHKEMLEKEGSRLRFCLLVSTCIMFLTATLLLVAPYWLPPKHAPDSFEKENKNTIVVAANVAKVVAWLMCIFGFAKNIISKMPFDWRPVSVAFCLCFFHVFHAYNFIVPYIAGGVQFRLCPVTVAVLVNCAFAGLEVLLLCLTMYRHRSAPLYLIHSESVCFAELEQSRVDETNAWSRLASMCKVDYAFFLAGCFGGLLATVANIGWQISFGNLIAASIHFDKPALHVAVHLQILSCAALYIGNSLQLCFVEAAGMRLVTRIQRFVFMAMMEQDMSFFDANKSGELTTMLSANTALIRTGMTTQLAQAFRGFFQFFIILVYLLINDTELTLIFLGSALVPLVILACTLTLISGISKRSAEAQNIQGGFGQEFLSGIRTIVSFSMQDDTKRRYDDAAWISNAIGVRLVVIQGLAFSMVLGGFYGALSIALWWGGSDIVDNAATPQELAYKASHLLVFVNMAIAMVMGLGWIMGGLPEMAKAVGASEKILEILDRQALVKYKGGKVFNSVRGEIVFEAVKFVYPTRDDKVVLNNFSLRVETGKTVALVGGSGSGKSTVLSLIERFYDPTEGSVRLDGVDLRILDPMWLRSQIGFVMQEPTLFAGTISENLRFGCPNATEEEMIDASKKANCHSFISGLPNGYRTVVGEQGTSLSGGQKQRVAIARAILKNPRILLLDEATSALDAESESLVQDALDKLMKGRTTIIVAHRLSTIRNADKIHVFHEGVVAESGSHQELLRVGGIYANLIAKQRGPSAPNFSLGSVTTPRLS
eukprot:g5723.t1